MGLRVPRRVRTSGGDACQLSPALTYTSIWCGLSTCCIQAPLTLDEPKSLTAMDGVEEECAHRRSTRSRSARVFRGERPEGRLPGAEKERRGVLAQFHICRVLSAHARAGTVPVPSGAAIVRCAKRIWENAFPVLAGPNRVGCGLPTSPVPAPGAQLDPWCSRIAVDVRGGCEGRQPKTFAPRSPSPSPSRDKARVGCASESSADPSAVSRCMYLQ